MERETGFEPATLTLARSHSTSCVTPAQRKTLFLPGNITHVKRYGKVTQTKAFINLRRSRFAVLFYFSVKGTEAAKAVRRYGRYTGDSFDSWRLRSLLH